MSRNVTVDIDLAAVAFVVGLFALFILFGGDPDIADRIILGEGGVCAEVTE